MSKKGFSVLFIFFLVLAAFNFFGANFLNDHVVHYTNFIFCSIAVCLGVAFAFRKGKGFELPVQLISISILISVLMAYLSWGQDFMYSAQVTVPALLWIFFFYLLHTKPPVKIIESIVFIYAAVYVVLYLFQFMNPGVQFFGINLGTGFDYGRGIYRIVFPGSGVFFLAVFIALSKLATQKTGKPLWILLVISGIIIPVMQVTRTFVAGVLIIYLFHFLKGRATIIKTTVIALTVGVFILLAALNVPGFAGLAEAQQQTQQQGLLDDPRIAEAVYFLKDFSPNIFSNILGNGVPAAPDQSAYGKYIYNLYTDGNFMEDVGIIGFFAMFGILGVTGYVMIWIKSFTLTVPGGYEYVKYYLWFLLATSFTWDTVFSNYYLITTVFALYIFQRVYEEEKEKTKEPSSRYGYNYKYGLPRK